MSMVVDAQILKGFFQESVLEIGHGLTESPRLVFDPEFRIYPLHVDTQGTLIQEWRAVVQPEWFDVWYADQIRDGSICEIEAPAEPQLRKSLSKLGFPTSTRDIWYARVCNSSAKMHGFCVLVSEDIDFYQPSEKNNDSARRLKILTTESGVVRKHFKKEHSIFVKPVVRFISDYHALIEAWTKK